MFSRKLNDLNILKKRKKLHLTNSRQLQKMNDFNMQLNF